MHHTTRLTNLPLGSLMIPPFRSSLPRRLSTCASASLALQALSRTISSASRDRKRFAFIRPPAAASMSTARRTARNEVASAPSVGSTAVPESGPVADASTLRSLFRPATASFGSTVVGSAVSTSTAVSCSSDALAFIGCIVAAPGGAVGRSAAIRANTSVRSANDRT